MKQIQLVFLVRISVSVFCICIAIQGHELLALISNCILTAVDSIILALTFPQNR